MPNIVNMPPIANPPLLQGAADAAALFRALVERPKEVKAFLDTWDGYITRYEKAVKDYGSIAQIEAMHAANEQKALALAESLAAAELELSQATKEAARIVNEAQSGIAAKTAVLQERQAALDSLMADAAASNRAAEKDIKQRRSQVDAAATAMEARLAEIVTRETLVNNQIERMRAAGIAISPG